MALSAQRQPPAERSVGPGRSDGLRVSLFECSLATGSLNELEQTARQLDDGRIEALWDLEPGVRELGVVRTCHRAEVVALHSEPLREFARKLPGRPDGWRVREGFDAIEHIYRVAAGLESLAWGEREVRQQIERASHSVKSRHPRPVLAGLFHRAVEAVQGVDASIGPRRSIASIAASCVLEEAAPMFPRVLVVGAGTVGTQVVEALGPYARATIVYRHKAPSEAFLRTTGARAVPVAHLREELPWCDVLVAAAKAGERILGRADLEGRAQGLVLVDLGLPRNVDPDVAELCCVRLIDLEELHRRRAPPAEASEFEERVGELAVDGARQLSTVLDASNLDHLMRAIEELRRIELERAGPHFAGLTLEERAAIEHFSQRLVRQLMRAPLGRLRALPPGPERELAIDRASRLLHPTNGP